MKTTTRKKEDWTKHSANFKDRNRLFLVRCPACNTENYGPAVASGTCAWCGWSEKPKK